MGGSFSKIAARLPQARLPDRFQQKPAVPIPRQTKAAGSGGRVTLLGFIELATLRQ
jgi:hypothetical protein